MTPSRWRIWMTEERRQTCWRVVGGIGAAAVLLAYEWLYATPVQAFYYYCPGATNWICYIFMFCDC